MADYKGTILTNKGRALLLKALSGREIHFSKAKLGDGDWSNINDPKSLDDLISLLTSYMCFLIVKHVTTLFIFLMDNQIIKLPAVIKLSTLSSASIYRLIKKCEFPKQLKLSERSSGWLLSEVEQWLDDKANARGGVQ